MCIFVWSCLNSLLSTFISRPTSEKLKLRRTDKLQHLLCAPGSFLLLRWRCHQAETIFFSERRDWMEAWGWRCSQNHDVTDYIVSWATHPSNRHLWFYSGSLQKRGGMPQFGHSEVLVCSGAGGVKLIHPVSKAQQHRFRNNDSKANSSHCKI